MVDIISECFRDYVETNWNDGNHSTPTRTAVMTTTDSPGKFKGTKNSALLIERGEIGFVQVDLGASVTEGGFRVRQWRTKIFCHEASSEDLQGQLNELMRILSYWQSGGGGAFSADDTDQMAYVQDLTQEFQSTRACDVYITFNGYYEEEVV